jgi:uncharacterized membrane protein
MRTASAIAAALTLAVVFGCQSIGSRGGGVSRNEEFRVAVPNFETDVKQGELRTITVSLHRGDYFKQDVKLETRTTKGISIEPSSILVKASDKPEVQFRIVASKEAALGEYHVYVKGTPKHGEPTEADFNVKAVAR